MLQSGHGRRDGRTDGRTDRRTDGRTDGVKPIYPPTTSFFGGYNKTISQHSPTDERVTRPSARMTARTLRRQLNTQCRIYGIPQCWYGLLLMAVDRRDRGVLGISNLVCGTSSSMHIHNEPSFLHTVFSYIIQRTDWICFELSFRFRRVNYSWWLVVWNCWCCWSGIVFSMQCIKT